jgi:trimethylamine:corrinoid methyltransferase-like protein
MTPLTQQLEDKKKGCGEKRFNSYHDCGEYDCDAQCYFYCNECKEIIAILEQAIAEIEKQRQEILEEIGYKIFSEDEQKSNNVWYKKGWDDNASRINKELQQLNQPKIEKENSKQQLTNSEGKI